MISYISGEHPFFNSYPIDFQEAIDSACALPELSEIRGVIGSIGIQVGGTKEAKALWCWKERMIKIHSDLLKDTKANQAAYLVFELFNVLQTPQFERAVAEAADVDSFVASIEKLEYASALSTQRFFRQHFEKNVEFDFKYVCPNFHEHYALNQISGHSECIARSYFPSASYRGTLCHPLQDLDDTARQLLYCLMYSKMTGKMISVARGSKPVGFKEILHALERHAASNDSYQKALECAQDLFQ